jgi:hypothetical protein
MRHHLPGGQMLPTGDLPGHRQNVIVDTKGRAHVHMILS